MFEVLQESLASPGQRKCHPLTPTSTMSQQDVRMKSDPPPQMMDLMMHFCLYHGALDSPGNHAQTVHRCLEKESFEPHSPVDRPAHGVRDS